MECWVNLDDSTTPVLQYSNRPWAMKIIWLALCAFLFALCLPADAQQPKKVSRIGFLLALEAAKQIGLTIPQKVLARADRVIM